MRHNISSISREQSEENINPSKNLENNENINPNENENNLIQRRNKNNNINLKEKKNSNGIQRYFGKNLLNYYNNELTNTNINNINEKQKNPFQVKSAFTLINHNNLSQPLLPIEKCVFETYELEQINNPQYCIEYSKEIFSFLKSNEKLNMPIYKNINLNKTEISEKSRKILIDWIISVHAKFNLLPNTLFLTINLIDRIIEKNVAHINSFQLLGTTALHIAAKYEEIYPPEINDYIFISNKAFSKEDVIEMENFILDKLNFDILCISPYLFLDRLYFISRENNIDVYYLTSMFIEFSFLSIEIMKNKQSLISASMFYLALKFIYQKKIKFGIINYKFILVIKNIKLKVLLRILFFFSKEILGIKKIKLILFLLNIIMINLEMYLKNI